ncbi:MAG: PilT/PilU family type 4a pilus ATPase [Myxococcota bacterium]
MAQDKPIPLVGRLAIQLKMVTTQEVARAMAESEARGNPRLAQVMLSMGLLDPDQVARLQQVQKELIEKQRAKTAGPAAPEPAPASRPAPARPAAAASMPPSKARPSPPGSAPPRPAPAAGGPTAPRPASQVHQAAEHAAKVAAPMTARDIDDLYETPTNAASASQPTAETPPRQAASIPSAAASASSEPRGPRPAPSPAAPAGPAPARAATVAASAPGAPSSSAPVAAGPVLGSHGKPSLELEVPEPSASDRERLEALLSAGVEGGASDIHLHAGGPLKQRRVGELVVVEEDVDRALVERMVSASLTSEQRDVLRYDGELDYCFDLPGIGRFRANAYRQQRGLDAVFRSIPNHPPTLEELGLPEELKKYTDYHQGMVLITGPAGCGKSATLAALVNHINESRDDHILTVEDPIEIVHPSKRCLVNQRHAGHHTKSFSRALRAALREDPDIIVIGELRDLETISLAMTAAETGHFVLATLHTANAVRTVNRMIGAFPSNEQDQVRAMLSESLRAVVSQRLVPTADGQGRVPALEMLVINRAIGNLIRDQKTIQIRSSMQTGKAHGMYLLEQSLNELVAQGRITREVALSLAEEQKLITAGA